MCEIGFIGLGLKVLNNWKWIIKLKIIQMYI